MNLSGTVCPLCGTPLDAEYKVAIYCDHVFQRDLMCHMVCAEQRDVNYDMELLVRVVHQRDADRFQYRPYSLVDY